MGIRVVCDSSSNVLEMAGIDYRCVPLVVTLDGTDYVDDQNLDIDAFCERMAESDGPSSSSCPSPDAWLQAFEGADQIVAIAISSKLSGSCNAARLAADAYREARPDAQIAVIDSRAAGEKLALIAERIPALEEEGLTFDELVQHLRAWQRHTHVLFDIADLSNLARNGRINPAIARFANALGVHVIGGATPAGEIEVMRKCRGMKKATKALIHEMQLHRYEGGPCYIAHVDNLDAAEQLAADFREVWPDADLRIERCRALCSYYAARGGVIVSYADGRRINLERDLAREERGSDQLS